MIAVSYWTAGALGVHPLFRWEQKSTKRSACDPGLSDFVQPSQSGNTRYRAARGLATSQEMEDHLTKGHPIKVCNRLQRVRVRPQ